MEHIIGESVKNMITLCRENVNETNDDKKSKKRKFTEEKKQTKGTNKGTKIENDENQNATYYSEMDEECKRFRKEYVKSFNESDPLSALRKIGQMVQDEISRSSCTGYKSTKEPFVIRFNEITYVFPYDKKVIIIGRHGGCDIVIPQDHTKGSRVGCILYLSPYSSEFAVVDVGGIFGWKLLSEKLKRPIESTATRRDFTIQKWNTECVLYHGEYAFVLQPTTCCVCKENQKQEMFVACGHKEICKECKEKLTSCPICFES